MPMTVVTSPHEDTDKALAAFLDGWREDAALNARTLVHAWTSGGGRVQVGHVAVRLLGGADDGTFTAGTVYAARGDDGHPRLEFARVLLESHGVSHEAWIHWSDESVELDHRGFDPAVKFPTLVLDADVTAAELARLATGLRDLARLVGA